MKQDKALELVTEIVNSEYGYKIELEYQKEDKDLKEPEGYNVDVLQSTWYPEDLAIMEKIAKKFNLKFTIEGERLDFFES